MKIFYTDYLIRRMELRRIPYNIPKNIIENSQEKYYDNETGRFVKIGKAKIRNINVLLAIFYEETEDGITVVTAHTISRQQINLRIKNQRWV